MTPRTYHYPTEGLGALRFIPWLDLILASMLAYLLFANPNFLIPSTRPAGYFGLLLAGATSFYFFRFDRHRRQHFETTDTALTVIGPGARRRAIPWSALHRAEFHTNTGALVLHHSARRGGAVLYPAALEHGAELVATIDAMTPLQLAAIPDLQAALARQR